MIPVQTVSSEDLRVERLPDRRALLLYLNARCVAAAETAGGTHDLLQRFLCTDFPEGRYLAYDASTYRGVAYTGKAVEVFDCSDLVPTDILTLEDGQMHRNGEPMPVAEPDRELLQALYRSGSFKEERQ